jgi:hypothetical protein
VPRIPNYNMDDLPDSATIPTGMYRAKLVKVVKKKTKDQKYDMLQWDFRIISGPLAAEKASLSAWTVFAPQRISQAYFKNLMSSFGRQKTTGGDSNDFVGKVLVIAVKEGPYIDKSTGEEKVSSRIIKFYPKDHPLKMPGKAELIDEGEEEPTSEETETTEDAPEETTEEEAEDTTEETTEEEPEEAAPPKKVKAKVPVKTIKKLKKPASEEEDELPF